MKQTSRGLAPSLNTGHSTFTGARQRLAVALVAIVIAFAGAQTAGAQTLCNVTFDISGKGTVEFDGETVTNGETIFCNLPSDLTLTPETGYYVSSVTYDAPDGLIIFLDQVDDFHWSLNINIHHYEGSETPTITVHIVFDKALAGGADEASAVALTSVDDLSRLTGGWYKVESDLTLGHTWNLHGDTRITIATGATLTVSTSDEYGIYGSALTVSGEGTLAVSANDRAIYVYNYTQMGCAVTLSGNNYGLNAKNNVSISGGSLTTSGADYGIGSNEGAITISGGTVSSSGKQCGLYAARAMNITGGTVSASGNVGNGIRGYSVSITGGQVTVSSGGISSNYGDITLGCTSATDYITASGFTVEEGFYVKIADGQTLYGGGFPSASFYGTVGDPSSLNGMMLRPTAAVTESGTNEYTIWNADGWDAFCDALQDNDTYNRFSGKTVRLGDDITVTRMAGSSKHDFCGTFDGGGNTLTVNISSDDITDGSTQYVAPFRFVSNTKADPSDEADSPAAFRNLHVTGTITTDKQFTGGLIGGCWGTVSIDNCAVSTAITSTISGDGTHGGIVGIQQSGALTITGCLFDGSLLGATTYAVGGFLGYRKSGAEIRNSLFAPAEVTVMNTSGATFARNKVDTYNSYYTYYLCDGTNYAPYDPADADHPDKYNNGHATRTVAAAADVTIEPIALTGTPTQYTVSGITAYSGGGLQRGQTLYYGSGDQLSLTLSNSATGAPAGYRYDGYTASAGTLSGYTLTMPDADVTISVSTDHLASTGQAVTVAYINADGTAGEASAIALDGTETSLAAGTYFAGLENVNFDHTVNLNGNVTIILKDGCTMNVGTSGSRIDGWGFDYNNNAAMTVFGQSLGSGALSVYNTGDANSAISVKALTVNGGNVIANTDGMASNGIYSHSDITINGGSVTAYCTGTGSEGIYAYGSAKVTINGGTVNATAKNYGVKGTITLGWTKPTDRITASSYSGTVAVADGKKLHNGSDYLGGTVSDPAAAVNGKTLRPAATATYTTTDGTAATADAILLDASDNSLPAGNYLATGTLNYTHGITLAGDVTLILADNCHMNVGTSGEGRFNGYGIVSSYDSNTDTMYDLTITSEANGSGNGNGALSVYTTGDYMRGITANTLTINGGNVTADTDGTGASALSVDKDVTINGGNVNAHTAGTGYTAFAIYASEDFNYNGGNVTATAPNTYAISADGNYTFSWRTPADRITIGATGLYAPDDKTATFARLFTDASGNIYTGTLTHEAVDALAGKHLYPYIATLDLAARQAPDENYWTTFYCGHTDYQIDANENACAYTATYGAGQLTLHRLGKAVPKATAVIIVADNGVVSMTAATVLPAFSGTNDLRGVNVDTPVANITSDLGEGTLYVLGMTTVDNEQHFGFHRYTGEEMAARKAFLHVPGSSNARALDMVFANEETGIGSIESGELRMENFYTLDGRKLNGKPTKPGLYINNGRKVVIK